MPLLKGVFKKSLEDVKLATEKLSVTLEDLTRKERNYYNTRQLLAKLVIQEKEALERATEARRLSLPTYAAERKNWVDLFRQKTATMAQEKQYQVEIAKLIEVKRQLQDSTTQLHDRLRRLGGPMSDFVARLLEIEHQAEGMDRTLEGMTARWRMIARGSILAGSGLAIWDAGMGTVRQGLAMATKFHLQYVDAIRMEQRGSILLGGSSAQTMRIQAQLTETTKRLSAATGLAAGDSAKYAASLRSSFMMADRPGPEAGEVPGTEQDFDHFASTIAQIGKASGLSADEMGKFNRTLLTTMHQTPKAVMEINSMLLDASKFGLTGSRAMEKVNEQMEAIQSLDASSRKAFIQRLLSAAGQMERAGADFGKYTKSLVDLQGGEAITGAAVMGQQTGRSAAEMETVMLRAKLGDADASADLAESRFRTALGMAGLNRGGQEKYIEDRSKFAAGGMRGDPVAEQAFARQTHMLEATVNSVSGMLGGGNIDNLSAGFQQAREYRRTGQQVVPLTPEVIARRELDTRTMPDSIEAARAKMALEHPNLGGPVDSDAQRAYLARAMVTAETVDDIRNILGQIFKTLLALGATRLAFAGATKGSLVGGGLRLAGAGLSAGRGLLAAGVGAGGGGTGLLGLGGGVAAAGGAAIAGTIAAGAGLGYGAGTLIKMIPAGHDKAGDKRNVGGRLEQFGGFMYDKWTGADTQLAKLAQPLDLSRLDAVSDPGDRARQRGALFSATAVREGFVVGGPGKNVDLSTPEAMALIRAGNFDELRKHRIEPESPKTIPGMPSDAGPLSIHRVSEGSQGPEAVPPIVPGKVGAMADTDGVDSALAARAATQQKLIDLGGLEKTMQRFLDGQDVQNRLTQELVDAAGQRRALS